MKPPTLDWRQVPPVIMARIPAHLTFNERVYWYSDWIVRNPYSHIHFKLDKGHKEFVSERHINL